MSRLPRRSFLRLGAAGAAFSMLPGCVQDALAIPARCDSRSIRDVKHVVVLLQENRAFDHYFGTYRGIRGFGDRFTIPAAPGETVFHQKQNGTTILPYHLDATIGNAQRVEGTPHSWFDAQAAWNQGSFGTWPAVKQPQSMGYYTRAELPFQFALAEAFTLCDAYHCSIHAGTNPNRLFAFTGTNDPLGKFGGPAIDNSHDSLGSPDRGYQWTTYAERLEKAGVSWKVYQDASDNFSDNPLVGFRTFRTASVENPLDPLVSKGIGTTLIGASLDGLKQDVASGQLPQVSWVVAPAEYSEHPGPSSPVQGAYYVQQVLEALTSNPDVWASTVLLVTFDENDGFFDHLPPPTAPSRDASGLWGGSTVDVSDEYHPASGFPYGPGPRVPMWIVSPFSRGGWVCSETFDHTSILRFLESCFGVREPNISKYRRAIVGDLTSAFDFSTPNDLTVPVLPSVTKDDADAERAAQEVLPPIPAPLDGAGTLPVQETGTRPSRALPYELEVTLRVDATNRSLVLDFESRGASGALFHVYDELDRATPPQRFAVSAGKSLGGTIALPSGRDDYALFVLGPNGFHRRFAGRATADLATASASLEYDATNGLVRVRCAESSGTARTFRLEAKAYDTTSPLSLEVAGRAESITELDVSASGLWYDLVVTLDSEPSFVRRFAGRMETCEPSVTDPAMGT